MFNRIIIEKMRQWSQRKGRKPLVLRGARQVGKTSAVDIFAQEFDSYIYLNLELKEDANLFADDLVVEELIQAIFFAKNIHRNAGRTLLFIDEIQNSSKAIAMLRYFFESAPDLYVIGAGSLLEVMIGKNQVSFPVGRVQYLFMYPLTFVEYLEALSEEQALDAYHTVPLPGYAQEKMFKLFHQYTLLGGMPEIIDTFSQSHDLLDLRPVYQGLISSYLDDVSKYARNATMIEVIRHAIETAPYEAGKRIRFQGFGKSNYKSREMGEALRTLQRAMLIHLLYPTTSRELPLIPDKKRSPKLLFLDSGLVNYYVGLQKYFYTIKDFHSAYGGMLAEHIIGQELIALDMSSPNKFTFWVKEKKQSNAEVDFILPYNQYAIPLEVKAGKTGTLRSLHEFTDSASHPYAIRLYAGTIQTTTAQTPKGTPYTLLSLPYFLIGKIYDYIAWMKWE
ncbi:MAG: AAA family ATPase [Pseudomonadota bacterium]|nr:AAA family ATPase [Pseudomonadota bacterium]